MAEDGKPAFGEIRDALTPPPGAGKDDLWAALKNAQVTGGHVPGRPAPDISMPAVTDPTGKGIHPAVLKALSSGATSLEDVGSELAATIYKQEMRRQELHARADHPELFPGDPFHSHAAPAIATAEMYRDFVDAGIPVTSVEAILGHMLAAFAAYQGSSPLADAESVLGRLLAALGDSTGDE